MRLVTELDLVHEELGKAIDGVVCACVAEGALKDVFGILVRFVADGTELVVGHAALGRLHAVTVRAFHFLLLEMSLVGEVEPPVCAVLRTGPQTDEHNEPQLGDAMLLHRFGSPIRTLRLRHTAW